MEEITLPVFYALIVLGAIAFWFLAMPLFGRIGEGISLWFKNFLKK